MLSKLSILNIPLGRWVGVPVTLHWSWVLMFLLVLFTVPKFAIVYAAVFFLVLLHECGHCLAAQYYSAPIKDIVLYPFGGAASMQIPRDPKQEFVIAIAGPAVNVLLIPLFLLIGPLNPILTTIGYYNIVLLVFNFIPALPMDGGRVLRATLTYFLKDRVKATLISGRVGQVIAVGFVILGFMTGHFMLAVIGAFVFMAAASEIQMSQTPAPNMATEYDVRVSADSITSIQDRLDRLDRINRQADD